MSVSIERRPRGWRLTARQWFPQERDEVFPFFADAGNLELITPPRLRFEILTPAPLEMAPGLLIDYRIRIRGIPVRWQTEISIWEPSIRFVDQQLRGPYRLWHHEHRFTDVAGGTLMLDIVDYDMLCGRLAHPIMVRNDLRDIFSYRYDVMAEHFGGRGRENDRDITTAVETTGTVGDAAENA